MTKTNLPTTIKRKSTQIVLHHSPISHAELNPTTPRKAYPSQIPIRILRLPDVMARVGLCRASIYNHMADGSFPQSISLGARAVGWLEHEIDAWLMLRMHARSSAPAANLLTDH